MGALSGRRADPNLLCLRLRQYGYGEWAASCSRRAFAFGELRGHERHDPASGIWFGAGNATRETMVRGLIFAAALSLPVFAETTEAPEVVGDYVQSDALRRLMTQWTLDEKIPKDWLERQFAGVTRQERVLELMNRPAEKAMPFYEYNDIFDTEERAQKGVNFWNEHESWVTEAERRFGVPSEIIVAIIGVETRFGEVMGSYRVIDALSTLAFDFERRSPFFTRELREFILLSREEGKEATGFFGSYAGAMGLPQFMPSSYRAYAVDLDDDGQRDIWETPADAIGSVANYLARNGWR